MKKGLSQNNFFLTTVYHNTTDCIIVADENRIITYMNPAAIKNFGEPFFLIPGKSPLTRIKITTKSTFNSLAALLKNCTPANNFYFTSLVEVKHLTTTSLFSLQLKAVKNLKTNKITDYILTFTQQNTLAEVRSKLIESDLKYKGLFENAQEGIFILDNKANIIDFNPSACAIYGISDFSGMSIFDVFPHNSPIENDAIWKNFLKTGTIKGFYKFTLPTGETTFIDFKARTNYLPNLSLAVFTNETEKRLTEIALIKSESNLKSIFENSHQCIILLDTNHTVLAANSGAIEMSTQINGRSVAVGENIINYVLDRKLFVSEFNRAINGEKIIVEHKFTDKSGNENWFEFNYNPIKNDKGKVVNINYTVENINKRKQEAIILKESEQKFRSLAENSPDIIYIIDLKLRKATYFNKDTVLGYSSSYLSESESWIEIVNPDDYKRVVEHWKKFLASKKPKTESIEYRVRKLDGEYEWVSNRHLVMERDSKGKPLKVLLILTIITERIKYQEALKQSESRLTALIENTNDIVWSIDNRFNLTTLNASFKELIFNNYKQKIKVGDNLYKALPGISQDGWIALHVSALSGKRVTAEFSWHSKKGTPIYFEISYNPIYDYNSNVSGVSVFARDITQRKTNEAIIVQTNFELDSFVYRASHDLRAPLRSILGLVNILNTEIDEADKINYIKLIEKSAIKLDNFISDLINFSRNSRATVDIEEISFESLIEDCIENVRYMEGAENVKITTSIKGDYEFYSDTKRISIFINNLLSNAIKYQHTTRKSFVQINVTLLKEGVILSIKDNGIGIKKEYIPKIFNMFYRASEKSFGSGLGLYIARQAVERIGGEIKVESKLGSGTTFTIALPNLEHKMFDFTSI